MSGLADQARALASQGASLRQSIFGVNQTGDPQLGRMSGAAATATFRCYLAADRSGELSIELGFKETHEFILRVDRTEENFTAEIGKSVVLIAARPAGTDLTVRITDIMAGGINPEFVCGCKSQF